MSGAAGIGGEPIDQWAIERQGCVIRIGNVFLEWEGKQDDGRAQFVVTPLSNGTLTFQAVYHPKTGERVRVVIGGIYDESDVQNCPSVGVAGVSVPPMDRVKLDLHAAQYTREVVLTGEAAKWFADGLA